MNQSRVLLAVALLSSCTGELDDPGASEHSDEAVAAPADDHDDSPSPADSEPAVETPAAQGPSMRADAGSAMPAPSMPANMPSTAPPASSTPPSKPSTTADPKPQRTPTAPVAPSTPSIGAGDLQHPAGGPAPSDRAKVSGAPFVLVKNWDFGSDGTVKNVGDLNAEFQYHDQFNTIANGTNYGAVTVAPSADTAIGAIDLRLDDDMQPVEDPANPTREFTGSSLLAYVRPLEAKQKKVKVTKHNAGNGSFTAKWGLPNGGALLGHDVLWETRVRMPKQAPGYWFALWTAGRIWNGGAEMDVVESFGAPHTPGNCFHSDTVGGVNSVDYTSWPDALTSVGVPESQRLLSDWHVWTWIYLRDDTYEVYYDGYRVQHGSIHWTSGGIAGGEPIDMRFLFDFSWGHTKVDSVDIELPSEDLPITYEIDYSRVYLR